MQLLQRLFPASAQTIQNDIRDRQNALVREARALLAAPEAEENVRVERLQRLGFTGVPEVTAENNRTLRKAQLTERLEKEEAYAMQYPGFRFVSADVMNDVCTKYGLVIGEVYRFTGEVPSWALDVIERSGLVQSGFIVYYRDWMRAINRRVSWHQSKEQAEEKLKELATNRLVPEVLHIGAAPKNELLIAAPKKMMRVNADEEVRNHRIVKRDPIVMIEVPGGFVVLAAWDEEGRDPRILNASNN